MYVCSGPALCTQSAKQVRSDHPDSDCEASSDGESDQESESESGEVFGVERLHGLTSSVNHDRQFCIPDVLQIISGHV